MESLQRVTICFGRRSNKIKQIQANTLQRPSREAHGKRPTRRKSSILQSFLTNIIRTVSSIAVFYQFLSTLLTWAILVPP